MNGRRIKRYCIFPDELKKLFQHPDDWPDRISLYKPKGCPADAEVQNVAYQIDPHCLVVIMEHKSFDYVAPGDPIPYACVEIARADLHRQRDGNYRIVYHEDVVDGKRKVILQE